MAEESKLRLATLLEADGVAPAVVNRLRRGYYDEFGDDDADTPVEPLTALVAELRNRGLPAFAQRVIDGEFDASREDSRRWMERQTGELSDLVDTLGLRDERRNERA